MAQATQALQSPNAAVRANAEKQLLALKRLPIEKLFELVSVVVGSTNDVGPRFHAVQALRTASVEKWPTIPGQMKLKLRDWSIESALVQRDEIVRSQLLALCAVLIKRMYLEQTYEEKSHFFATLRQHSASQAAGVLFSTQVELELMQNIVSEFSHETASSIGMPFAFHHECKQRFEREFLQTFFDFACAKGKETFLVIKSKQGAQIEDQLYLTTIAGIETMVQILQTWDFRRRIPTKFFGSGGAQASSEGGAMSLKPGKEWRARLLSDDLVSWVYDLNSAAHGGATAVDDPLACTARQLIVILASLHGDIFLPDSVTNAQNRDKVDPLKLAHLGRILLGIQAILLPCDQVVGLAHSMQNEQRLRDGCTALSCLAEHNRLSVLTMASASAGPPGTCIGIGSLLSTVTLACIQCGGGRDDQMDSAVGTSLTALLEAWDFFIQTESVAFGMRQQSLGYAQAHQLHEESGIKEGGAHVFGAYLDSLLVEAAETALDDLDEEEEEQSLEMRQQKLGPLSSIARVCAEVNFDLVCQKLAECQANIARHARDEANLARCFEQLCCLLEISGYCIADSVGGEVPLIPILLMQCHDVIMAMNRPDPVIQLSSAILDLAQKLAGDQKFQQLYSSPRILECLIQCLTKWIATYLMSEDEKMPSRIREAYTLNASVSLQVLDLIIRLLGNTFVKYMGEMKVQEQVCKHLLPALVQGKQRRVNMVKSAAWNEFLSYYVHSFDALSLGLRGDLHRHFVKHAIGVARKPLDNETIQQYLGGVMDPMLKRLSALGATLPTNQSNQAGASRINMQQVEFILEGLRGAAQSFSGIGLAYLMDIFVSAQPILLRLLNLQGKSPRMIYLILKLTAEVIGGVISELDAARLPGILNFVYEVLRLYKRQNLGSVSLERAKSLKDEEAEEKYKNIRALLKLLTTITERDMVDFTSSAVPGQQGQPQVDIATATFVGLEMVVPLLSKDLLTYPKLSHQYFDLIGHMVEVYPGKVCSLPRDLFQTFVETLKFGVECTDYQNIGQALDALYHLVKAHLQSVSMGGAGLGGNMAAGDQGTFVSLFMKIIWHKLIYEDYPSSLIEQCSSVLLVLMIAENETFQQIGVSIINSQAQEDRRAALQATLNGLASSIQSHSNLTRQSRRKFSREFDSFVVDIRGIAKSV